MGTHLGFKASLVAAIPGVLCAGRLFPAALCRQKHRQKTTDRRRLHGRGGAGAGGFFLCRSFARYRRTELLCSQFHGGTADFLDVSRSGAHRPGTGGRHRLLHHARRGVQLLAPLIRTEAEQRFHSPHAGPLVLAAFALLCAALLWALKTGAPT